MGAPFASSIAAGVSPFFGFYILRDGFPPAHDVNCHLGSCWRVGAPRKLHSIRRLHAYGISPSNGWQDWFHGSSCCPPGTSRTSPKRRDAARGTEPHVSLLGLAVRPHPLGALLKLFLQLSI